MQAAVAAGHQYGSHTWGHPDLTLLAPRDVQAQITVLNNAMKKIIGRVPTYLRPPYGSYNDAVLPLLQSVGISTVVMWDLEPGDTVSGTTISDEKAVYNTAPIGSSYNVLHHETVASTATTMVPFMISWAQSRGLRMVTVADCLGGTSAPYYDFTTPESRNPSWTCNLPTPSPGSATPPVTPTASKSVGYSESHTPTPPVTPTPSTSTVLHSAASIRVLSACTQPNTVAM